MSTKTRNGKAKTAKNPHGAGRPTKNIDIKVARQAFGIGCTNAEVAALFDMHPDTFTEKIQASPELRAAREIGRNEGKATLRRAQWKLATRTQNPNPTMQIWLGKQLLGQKDRHIVTHEEAPPLDLSSCSTEELAILRQAAAIVKAKAEQRASEVIDADFTETPALPAPEGDDIAA